MNANEESGFKAISPKGPEDNFLNFPKKNTANFFSRKMVVDIGHDTSAVENWLR